MLILLLLSCMPDTTCKLKSSDCELFCAQMDKPYHAQWSNPSHPSCWCLLDDTHQQAFVPKAPTACPDGWAP